MSRNKPTRLLSCVVLLLSIDAAMAAESRAPQNSEAEAPEEIEVQGQQDSTA